MIQVIERKREQRNRRKRRIRTRVIGTSARPRLTVFRSLNNIYAQVIDDQTGRTLAAASTQDKDLRENLAGLKKRQAAEKVGEAIAERCKQQSITKVVFDRNGYKYQGRVAVVADSARKKGLSF